MSPLNITQPLGIWSIMATIRWCPIYPKWDIYQPLLDHNADDSGDHLCVLISFQWPGLDQQDPHPEGYIFPEQCEGTIHKSYGKIWWWDIQIFIMDDDGISFFHSSFVELIKIFEQIIVPMFQWPWRSVFFCWSHPCKPHFCLIKFTQNCSNTPKRYKT